MCWSCATHLTPALAGTLLAMCSESTFSKWHNRGMAHFAILRVQKLKSAISVHRSLKHSFRDQDTPNAVAERTPTNSHIGASSVGEAMAAFRSRLPEKHRKDAVQCIEYLIAASPEVMARKDRKAQDAYFAASLDWLKAKHGAENVVYAGVHRDEKSPHMYAYVVPRVGEKLNCRQFLGGAKALSLMQTDFHKQVGIKHDLQRGLEGSKARHTTIKQHYAAIQKPAAHMTLDGAAIRPKVLKKGWLADDFEKPEQIAERLTKAVRIGYSPAVEASKVAALDKKAAREARASLDAFNKRLGPVLEALKNAPPGIEKQLIEQMGMACGLAIEKNKAEARIKANLEKEAKEQKLKAAEAQAQLEKKVRTLVQMELVTEGYTYAVEHESKKKLKELQESGGFAAYAARAPEIEAKYQAFEAQQAQIQAVSVQRPEYPR